MAKDCDTHELADLEWDALFEWVETTKEIKEDSHRHAVKEELNKIKAKAYYWCREHFPQLCNFDIITSNGSEIENKQMARLSVIDNQTPLSVVV